MDSEDVKLKGHIKGDSKLKVLNPLLSSAILSY